MLPQVVEAKRGHGRLPIIRRRRRPASLNRARQPESDLRAPERLFGFMNDVAPGQADVMQLTLGPACEFAPLRLALAPDMEGFPDLGEKARTMTIYHRFMCKAGHFGLLKLS